MAFSREDVEALIVELQRDPQLRDRVRSAILADDFLALPRIVADLGEKVGQLTERMDRLTQRMDQLTERMDQLTERMDQLTQRMDQLTERMDQLAERMDQLAERMDQLTGRVDALTVQIANLALQVTALTGIVQLHDGRLGNVEGRIFEFDYRSRLSSRLGRRYKKVRPVDVPELEPVSTAYSTLVAAEWDDLLEIDAAAWAQPRTVTATSASSELLVVLELSRTVNADDVRRIHRPAEILRRLGLPVEAAVDGEFIRPDARELAEQLGVVTLVVKEPQAA